MQDIQLKTTIDLFCILHFRKDYACGHFCSIAFTAYFIIFFEKIARKSMVKNKCIKSFGLQSVQKRDSTGPSLQTTFLKKSFGTKLAPYLYAPR